MPEISVTLNAPEINEQSHWEAKLSDGRVIVEDVIKGAPTAWSRMRRYLAKYKNIKILEFSLTFGDRRIIIPQSLSVDGYFFSGRSEGVIGVYQMDFRGVGYVVGGKIYVSWARPATNNFPGGVQQEIMEYKEGDPRVIMN